MPIRLWSAGASTGQEAYSLAITFANAGLGPARGCDILATDIARAPLARGRAGRYSDFEVRRGLPGALLHRFFTRDRGEWAAAPELRRMVRFEAHNLLDAPPGECRFDVVFCRNVLIYFDLPTRHAVLDRIADSLVPGGLLYLGAGESLAGVSGRFAAYPGTEGAYEVKQ